MLLLRTTPICRTLIWTSRNGPWSKQPDPTFEVTCWKVGQAAPKQYSVKLDPNFPCPDTNQWTAKQRSIWILCQNHCFEEKSASSQETKIGLHATIRQSLSHLSPLLAPSLVPAGRSSHPGTQRRKLQSCAAPPPPARCRSAGHRPRPLSGGRSPPGQAHTAGGAARTGTHPCPETRPLREGRTVR